MDKAVITCALNGVLTNPKQHPVPVSPAQMAVSAKEAFDAGAVIMHIHFRMQDEGLGHLPSWQPEVARACSDAIREACPGVIINQTTGVVGPDVSGPIACLNAIKPEIAACNAGSLNYLKLRKNNAWAWPPMLFDNPVSKVDAMLTAMKAVGAQPEFECFDVGIVRSIDMFVRSGMTESAQYNFVMGVASGMPVDAKLLELLLGYRRDDALWQVTAIGRAEIWPLHQRVAELGGMLRTGVEDTFYLPNGERTTGNGPLIESMVVCAENAGRGIASPSEARTLLGLTS